MAWLLQLLLGLAFFGSLLTSSIIRNWPAKELRHKAQSEANRWAGAFYSLSHFGSAALAWLWLLYSASLISFIFVNSDQHSLFYQIACLAIGLAFISWTLVSKTVPGWLWPIGWLIAAPSAQILAWLGPLPGMVNKLAGRVQTTSISVFDKQDLKELLKAQQSSQTNRINDDDIARAKQALSFGERSVGQVMTPNREVKFLEAAEPISPAIMDELHKTGQIRFPLTKVGSKPTQPDILGTLYIGDLLKSLHKKGKLRDLMNDKIAFINESCDMQQALDVCLKSGNLLLIVVNGNGQSVGVLPIEKILSEALGELKSDDFVDYDSPHLAAEHEPYSLNDKQ